MEPTSTQTLIDRFGRRITYVRLSVTDRCDFRCVYCMNEDVTFQARSQILSIEEIAAVGRAFCNLGVNKIRLTGGEPLLRRNLIGLIEQLAALPNRPEICLTTNGSQLARWASALKDAGVNRMNISLDTLRPDRFRALTRIGDLQTVLDGIRAAQNVGFRRTKLNSVILRNQNHDETSDLVQFAVENQLDITFIEEMPLGDVHHHDRAKLYCSSQEILADLTRQFTLIPTDAKTGGPSRYYQVAETTTRVGFISPHSHNFCGDCNRVRVTAEGRLLLCLGQEHSVDLRDILRSPDTDQNDLQAAIRNAMAIKPLGHEFSLTQKPHIIRFMNVTGG